ncbi:MAG: NB-ARC domain-containing protein [Cyanobacteria bacterium]|nr:NB-ARC domain-containing protein [Cyanobacteriota bacterium]MDW8200409.1 NB-ARC domain-containing protein [Cyanobacteriota bacterium SKYGB_h_bin112]
MTPRRSKVGLKASHAGLLKIQERVQQIRWERGWIQDSDQWLYAASQVLDATWHEGMPPANGASMPTWKRFLRGKDYIKPESFKAFCTVLALNWEEVVERDAPYQQPSVPSALPQQSWGEAPDTTTIYGRDEELAMLTQWIVGGFASDQPHQRCRLVMVLGMGGIGKTTVATRLARMLQDQFDRVIWRSLLNAPPLTDLLDDLLRFLTNEPDRQNDLAHLLDCLRSHRCLLVLDNAESILQSGSHAGSYRPGYEGYGDLLRSVGESVHQSCMILTSREKPNNLVILEGEQPVRSLQLAGLPETIGRQILTAMDLKGTADEQRKLVERYSGNPQALKLVAAYIRELCNGHIGEFLRQGVTFFSSIRTPLDQQFNRLSPLEQAIMYWLAINREPMSVSELIEDIIPTESPAVLLEALGSLVHRCLIEEVTALGQRSALTEPPSAAFTQQPVVMEYMTDRLIDQVVAEILECVNRASSIPDSHSKPVNDSHQRLQIFHTYALIKAQAKDYVRDSQVRLILKPIATRLQQFFGTHDALLAAITQLLAYVRHHQPTGYGGGNVLNLCRYLRIDLTGYDFSHLTIRQAYLPDVNLHNVNFSHAHILQSVFAQNLGGFLTVLVSPDGQWLATGDNNGEVLLWNLANGTQRFAFREHTAWVNALAFSPDSRLLATGGDDEIIRLWDVETGQCLQTLQGHGGSIHALAFCLVPPPSLSSKWGSILASGGDDQTICLWEVSTGTCLNQWHGHDDRIISLAFSPDGQYLVSGDLRHIKLWDVATGLCHQTLDATTNRNWAFSFPDWLKASSLILAAGSDDRAITLWNVNQGRLREVLSGHTDTVQTVTFSQDGTLLASSSADHTIKLWDMTNGECLQTFGEKNHGVWSLSFGPLSSTNLTLGSNDGVIVSGGDDQMVKLWDVASGKCLRTMQGHMRRVWSFALSHDHQTLATGSDDRKVRLWDVATGQCLGTLTGHTDWVWAVAFGFNDRLLASGSDDNTIRLWDVSTGQCLQTLRGHSDRIHTVAFRPVLEPAAQVDADIAWGWQPYLLASGSSDQTIRLWNFMTGECLNVLQGHTNRIWSLAFNPTGDRIASGSYDSTVRLWDVTTGECLQVLRGHSDRVHTIAFCPVLTSPLVAGELLASAGDDQVIKVWNVATGECIQLLQGHTQRVCSLAFSPDGSQLVTGSDDHTICLWDLVSGSRVKVLQGHTNRVWFTRLIANGQRLISGSHDGTVKLWAVNLDKCYKTLGPGKPYEGMNIYNTTGLTSAQRSTLRSLGATETMRIA